MSPPLLTCNFHGCEWDRKCISQPGFWLGFDSGPDWKGGACGGQSVRGSLCGLAWRGIILCVSEKHASKKHRRLGASQPVPATYAEEPKGTAANKLASSGLGPLCPLQVVLRLCMQGPNATVLRAELLSSAVPWWWWFCSPAEVCYYLETCFDLRNWGYAPGM